ncbi:hypothetical protein SAMN05216206_3743 [Pseudomonas guineae]|uniref:Uncharacterized protein n=1 Tax=Pseudomonas guineae TaxID=425504 RepID=A0A1I3PM75_9PSED|nr:hypothetical protein [Pseudomonas guineae]SFJ22450.1 hypothetical protein SAMN05216206_3743 [Pseudomonas guineae]
MFIYLDSSISNCLNSPVHHNIIDGIQGLAFMLRSGVHLVSGDRNTLTAISNLEEISSSARASFKRAVARHAQANSVLNHMSTYVLVDYGRAEITSSVENGTKVIKIPISNFSSIIAQISTEVVYEDINDAVIYNIVAQWYSETILNNPHLRIKSKPVQGGGSRTCDIYNSKQISADTFCLCITDSDKKYPTDTPGDTSTKVRNIEDTLKPLSFHLNLDFHEIENLIPLEFLRGIAGTDDAREIIAALKLADENQHQEAKLFWDYKKGVRAHYLKNNERFRSYWCAALGVTPAACETECTLNKCDCFLINPWPLKQDLKSAIERKDRMDPSDCEVMRNLWTEIGSTVVSWTIGSSPSLT